MLRFFVNRLFVAVLVAITVSIISFGLLRMSGDLAAELAGDDASDEDIARIARDYGLDRPLYIQYLDWAGSALRGDLGQSVFTHEPVSDIIRSSFPVTLKLAVFALIFSVVISVPLGVLAAVKQNTIYDRGALVFAVFGQAVPSFWFALMLILVFGVILKWLPISGQETWRHFILPIICVTLFTLPAKMRLTRAGMTTVLDSDYVRTARAKGLSKTSIFFKHALRNAILPVVAIIMVSFGRLLGGTVVVETIFTLNGMGYEVYHAILRMDFPVVQTVVAMISFVYIVLTLLSDLLNARLDPRIRLT